MPFLLAAQSWKGVLIRTDGIQIPFAYEVKGNKWLIKNAEDKIELTASNAEDDSILARFPVYESYLKAKRVGNKMFGYWYKAGTQGIAKMRFEGTANTSKFPSAKSGWPNLSGRYKMDIEKDATHSIGEFTQRNSILQGSILQWSGDLGYVDGSVKGDSIFISAFEGVHALFFKGKLNKRGEIKDGIFYSRDFNALKWQAVKDETVELDYSIVQTTLKEGTDSIASFAFEDLDGNRISIKDEKFKNKVVVVQVLGTWCPNCLDETNFLVPYYEKNKSRGVEVVALAYEYSADKERSLSNLKKLRDRLKVNYPVLWTGVSVADPELTEKTIPQLNKIMLFPSTIFIGKNGKIMQVDTDFNGPATGKHYEEYKQNFEKTITDLLAK